ncbi:MAG: zinc ribbon domain-containing protein [Endomicrobia bacterium]|nr:zinc ribbon domain-containing protein [Endomicrobiia bacterium]
MPMDEDAKFGTNADNGKNGDYCCYCWKDGKFTADITLDEAIERNIPFVIKAGAAKTDDEARAMLKGFMPKLKRWAIK